MMAGVERPRTGIRDNEVKKHLLAEGVFQLIAERIIDGDLAPGARIRDADLAAELSVSRTPVREALQRLERIGLVVMYPSRYTEVSSVTDDSVHAAREFAGYQAGIIARLACPRLTEDDLETLSELISEVSQHIDDPVACSQARHRVIDHLAAHAGNPLQQTLIDDATPALARALRALPLTPEQRPRVLTAYGRLEDALRGRNADAAERAFRAVYDVA
ncbi:GntR family transcriptional regulator [Microbacterium soli]|uniref:GntR family transcriptional regulator n=2 Tax=Microbacterium soli TaxID=446075 RepID=A0ABP7NB62_9MICO